MTLGDHLEELRARVILAVAGLGAGFVICFGFGKQLLYFILEPFRKATEAMETPPHLTAIFPAEKFIVYCKVALLFGLIISCPWIFYQVWKFVSAGLYKKEKRLVQIVSPISSLLFVAGAMFFILFIGPMVMKFFINFDVGADFVEANFSLQHYVDFITTLTIIFGLAFQMPIVIVTAQQIGLVKTSTLSKVRKFVVLAIAAVAAIATPPDVISQISLAIPLYLLYEVSIITCKIFDRK